MADFAPTVSCQTSVTTVANDITAPAAASSSSSDGALAQPPAHAAVPPAIGRETDGKDDSGDERMNDEVADVQPQNSEQKPRMLKWLMDHAVQKTPKQLGLNEMMEVRFRDICPRPVVMEAAMPLFRSILCGDWFNDSYFVVIRNELGKYEILSGANRFAVLTKWDQLCATDTAKEIFEVYKDRKSFAARFSEKLSTRKFTCKVVSGTLLADGSVKGASVTWRDLRTIAYGSNLTNDEGKNTPLVRDSSSRKLLQALQLCCDEQVVKLPNLEKWRTCAVLNPAWGTASMTEVRKVPDWFSNAAVLSKLRLFATTRSDGRACLERHAFACRADRCGISGNTLRTQKSLSTQIFEHRLASEILEPLLGLLCDCKSAMMSERQFSASLVLVVGMLEQAGAVLHRARAKLPSSPDQQPAFNRSVRDVLQLLVSDIGRAVKALSAAAVDALREAEPSVYGSLSARRLVEVGVEKELVAALDVGEAANDLFQLPAAANASAASSKAKKRSSSSSSSRSADDSPEEGAESDVEPDSKKSKGMGKKNKSPKDKEKKNMSTTSELKLEPQNYTENDVEVLLEATQQSWAQLCCDSVGKFAAAAPRQPPSDIVVVNTSSSAITFSNAYKAAALHFQPGFFASVVGESRALRTTTSAPALAADFAVIGSTLVVNANEAYKLHAAPQPAVLLRDKLACTAGPPLDPSWGMTDACAVGFLSDAHKKALNIFAQLSSPHPALAKFIVAPRDLGGAERHAVLFDISLAMVPLLFGIIGLLSEKWGARKLTSVLVVNTNAQVPKPSDLLRALCRFVCAFAPARVKQAMLEDKAVFGGKAVAALKPEDFGVRGDLVQAAEV